MDSNLRSMLRLLWVFLLGLTLSSLRAASEEDALKAARAIRDTASLDFARISRGASEPWVLLEVKPDASSGRGRLKGGYIDGTTGTLVTPPGARVVVPIEGTCKVLAVLAGKTDRTSFPYNWEEEAFSRKKEDDETFSPFRTGGGAIVCSLDQKGTGASHFRSVSLLPDGWQAFVVDAFTRQRADSGPFNSTHAPEKIEELRRLLRDKNPLIAASACRALGESGELPPGFCGDFVAGAEMERGALLLFLALERSPKDIASRVEKEAIGLIERAASCTEIEGIALAALAAFSRPPSRQEHARGLELLRKLRSKRLELAASGGRDEHLVAILRLAGLETRATLDEKRK